MTHEVTDNPIIIRFSDPGLHPTEFKTYQGCDIEQALNSEVVKSYTKACITINGKDHWLQRFLGCTTWLPFALHQELRPYFSPEDV